MTRKLPHRPHRSLNVSLCHLASGSRQSLSGSGAVIRNFKADNRFWRILAINVATLIFGTANRVWSMCEENTACHSLSVVWPIQSAAFTKGPCFRGSYDRAFRLAGQQLQICGDVGASSRLRFAPLADLWLPQWSPLSARDQGPATPAASPAGPHPRRSNI
jgi:hypothetical protein